ncbi:MAG: hypothetical protein OJF49_003352 [Ktedonobacterales bacterium]|jgi:hypothetical protein|nr:MAG: hypothetical protein OJF49_003352 [Ktedonobacterales bacterium]
MKRALLVVSICTLLALGVAVVGRALVVTQGVTYTPSGQPADPTPLAITATLMEGIGSVLAALLCLATFVLGVATAAARKRSGWVAAFVVAGLLALVGFVGMAWVLLSVNSPVAWGTPLALVPLVALLYALRPDPAPATAAR